MIDADPQDLSDEAVASRARSALLSEELLNRVGKMSPGLGHVREELQTVVNRYRTDKVHDERSAASTASQNGSIKVMRALANEARHDATGHKRAMLEAMINQVDPETAWRIQIELLGGISFEGNGRPPLGAFELDEIDSALAKSRFRRRGPQMTGPALRNFVWSLLAIYERATGETATHTPYQKTEYKGVPNSAAGRFVLAVSEGIGVRTRATAISSLMAEYVNRPAAEPVQTF